MKMGALVSAAFFGVSMFFSSAQASPTFDYNYALKHGSVADGIGAFTLTVNPTTLPALTNVSADLTNFSFTINGNTFNLSNGHASALTFLSGNLFDLTYSGSFRNSAGFVISLAISATQYVYFNQQTGQQIIGNLILDAPVTNVPEPSSWSLMLLALFAAFGLTFLRSRRAGALSATA